jgi:hypothetical protein
VSQLGVPEQKKVVSATDVMVDGPHDVFVERNERLERVAGRLFEGRRRPST